MKGQDRLHIGQAHEQRVATELINRGWAVQAWGQGLFTDETRQALNQKAPVVLWRWIPDLIATRGDRAVLVDPKTDLRTDTPNFSIEINALQAHLIMGPLGLRIVYVWGDLTCNFPENLVSVGSRLPDPGRDRVSANGSGTPFMLVRKAEQLHLDQLFGPPISETR